LPQLRFGQDVKGDKLQIDIYLKKVPFTARCHWGRRFSAEVIGEALPIPGLQRLQSYGLQDSMP
jgi:hypothetical protein